MHFRCVPTTPAASIGSGHSLADFTVLNVSYQYNGYLPGYRLSAQRRARYAQLPRLQ
jgi:hypothetical protein